MASYGAIPTSKPVSSSGGSGSGSGVPANLEFLSRAKDRIKSGLGTRRPWKQMLNIHSVGCPSGFGDLTSRVKANAAYFRMNYAIIVLIVLFLSLIWYPISMIVFVVLMAAWVFLYFLRDEPLMIFNRTIDDRVVLAVLSVVTIGGLLLTGETWVILGAVLIGLVVVLVHALIRKTDDLYVDEEEGI